MSEDRELRVLLVEDNPHDRLVFERAFKGENVKLHLSHFLRAEDALDHLGSSDSEGPNILVTDFKLPGITGLELCRILLRDEPSFPLVLLTGGGSEELAVEAMKAGVHDYIVKDPSQGYLKLIPLVIEQALNKFQEHKARIAAEQALRESEERYRKLAGELEELVVQKSRQLIDSTRLAEIGTMTAGVAHEINNVLTPLLGNLEFLKYVIESSSDNETQGSGDSGEDDSSLISELEPIAQDLHQAVETLRTMVKALTSATRNSHSDPCPHIIDPLVRMDELISIVKMRTKGDEKRKSVGVHIEHPETPVLMDADPTHFFQIAVNLAINAVDAIQERGFITISFFQDSEGMACMRVADDGPGIPAEILNRIFEAFFTTKPDGLGTGLGLAVCRQLAIQNGGSLEVETRPGKGTDFILRLPSARE